ncbi:glycoside hydrolase family 88 protein [Cytophaga sp. FL35]|uniref:glycoside hydrolase family 88 protein n=1 Tax=Cytophaga sp. FL35 TaxID=1904456 RepID=UPI0016535DF2|nr:glycoside hydrolase family 88 protein [Cytophaga sp. FL35]MBC6998471.1 glycoside hydrolase family 88 protein [Cytophaga sp. FL35]
MNINFELTPKDLLGKCNNLWTYSSHKIKSMHAGLQGKKGSPVVTVNGVYEPRSWTDWTQGFQYGSELFQFDATGDSFFLNIAIDNIKNQMTSHVSHFGVHDHGFNNLSTYGNLLRLLNEGKVDKNDWLKNYCQLALKLSASVQAQRWTHLPDGGFIYSFNGPHSLFVDTIRTIRILVVGRMLGHESSSENDVHINLLERACLHGLATAKYSIFYGEGRDEYDEWGRTAHEAIFNTNDGNFRSPSTQQGYSGYSTWTRGLSWAMLGFAEQLEFLQSVGQLAELEDIGGKDLIMETYLKAAKATCDFYIKNTAKDGIPYWDTGAPGLSNLNDWQNENSQPFNKYEPVDSSAAAIGAQGLLRLGNYLKDIDKENSKRYISAGLTVANTLFDKPFLSSDTGHQGLLLHTIYHRPNGWDHIPEGSKIPNGEACMWGDYHARELAYYIQGMATESYYYTFYKDII